MNKNNNKYWFNLREAKSTPYLHPSDTNSKSFKNNTGCRFYSVTQLSLKDANHDYMENPKKIFFNAGCSSSSTDINKLIQFYNDSADLDVVAHWIKVYEDHKLKCKNEALQNDNMKNGNCSNEVEEENINRYLHSCESFDSYDSDCDDFLMSFPKYKDKYKDISKVNDLCKEERYTINNRSLDNFTQEITTKLPFKMPNETLNLEKCASADFRSNKEKIKEKKLERCKEMLNISSIGDGTN
ncbi:Hypothetical protein SRAE_X000105300 [Strongyloides ratti]|uniref:Uncharacterized protein n=1 Tax=Strongyloides ratti TaxID=34506 RepID=A0A090KVN5_STRRB|nr:Hypothetical protein SRAE_X000105300 [Strongyloides ratti]CEF59302.2 Hypothetical protein SRAE_X000105300 [Strongyloides ratti]